MDDTPAGSPVDGRPIRHNCVLDELLADGSMVLFHTGQRQLMTLNPTAAFVWEHLDGTYTPSEIASALREVFPLASSAEADVHAVIRDLAVHGMLAPTV